MQETTLIASGFDSLPIDTLDNTRNLDALFTSDDGMADCSAACGCSASSPAPNAQEKEPAEMADWYFSIVDAWVVLPPRMVAALQRDDIEAAQFAVQSSARKALATGEFDTGTAFVAQPKAEECITGCGDSVETRNGKAVGCLHGEDCHSITDGCL